jgi:hypothetical protein
VSQKERALELVKQARDEWCAGDMQSAWETLDAAAQALCAGGHTPESMPGIFGYITFLQDSLRRLIDEAAS